MERFMDKFMEGVMWGWLCICLLFVVALSGAVLGFMYLIAKYAFLLTSGGL